LGSPGQPNKAQPAPEKPVAPRKPASRKRSRPKKAVDQSPTLQRIVEALEGFTHRRLFLAGSIPAHKLNGALRSYAEKVKREDVLLLYDGTVFGGAEHGLILTGDAVYWRNYLEDVEHIRYADIKGVRVDTHIVVDNKEIHVTMSGQATTRALAEVIRQMRDR